jgi:DNA-binding PadR family transcriptional regulator
MRTKFLRGLILDFLHRIYPREIEKVGIIEAFYKDWKPKEIERALGYLRDKGYVEEKKIPHPVRKFERILIYRLTPNGIDVLERTVEDSGIAFWEDE